MERLINWLNAADEDEEIRLQREGPFAMLTWRDFNQPPRPVLTFRGAAVLFFLALTVPLLAITGF